MVSTKNKNPRGPKEVSEAGTIWPRAGIFKLGEPLENILGPDYREKEKRFKSALLKYIKNPEGANTDEIIRFAREAWMDLWPEKKEDGDKSYYEMLLKGKKNKNHYFFIALEIFRWGHAREAIDYLETGISQLPVDQTSELVRLKNEFEILPIYIGASEYLMERIRKAAKTDMDILIEGETGTGKELVAHLIHDLSKRGGETTF